MPQTACISSFRAKAGQWREDIIITHALQAFNSLVLHCLFAVCSYIHFPKWHLRSPKHTRKPLSVIQWLLISPNLIHHHQNDRIMCFDKQQGLPVSRHYVLSACPLSNPRWWCRHAFFFFLMIAPSLFSFQNNTGGLTCSPNHAQVMIAYFLFYFFLQSGELAIIILYQCLDFFFFFFTSLLKGSVFNNFKHIFIWKCYFRSL